MAETKRTRLYKVAKEFNLSHDTLIAFLKKKGCEVKNHMSVIDETMLGLIEQHYKKEKSDAERLARKRKEFDEIDKRRRGEDQPAEEEAAVQTEEIAAIPPVVEEPPLEELPDAEETKTVEPPVAEDVAETLQPEIVKTPVQPPAAEVQETDIVVPEAPVAEVVEQMPETEPDPVATMPPVAEVVDSEVIPRVQPPATAPDEPEKSVVSVDVVVEAEPEVAEKIIEVSDTEEVKKEEKQIIVEKTREEEEEKRPEKKEEQERKIEPEKKKEPKKEEKAKGRGGVKKEDKKAESLEGTHLSIDSAVPKMRGLTVVGTIDLDAPDPVAERKTEPRQESTVQSSDDEKPKRKKRKKKKELPVAKPAADEPADKKLARKTKRGTKVKEVDQAEVASAIKKTIASMSDFGTTSQRTAVRKRKRARREEEHLREIEQQEREKKILRIYEYATVSEIASLMNVNVSQVIQALIGLGVMASINQRLEFEVIEMVASEFGFEVQPHEEIIEEEYIDKEDDEDSLVERPPIVTIMGHVDHGKTKLLDFIRKTNVVAGESGGITQHIGAYTVTLESGRKITFLDTPGHEAFTAMRARGAQVTDIVVLVVAADDSVMPQTVEAISHAQAAKVPIVVALNKIDKPEANLDKVKQQLADRGVLVEEWGGKYGCVAISAKHGINIDELLERILLEADIMEYKANPDREARGTVIEAELDKGKGIIATVLVQKGTLRIGDAFVAGNEFGKVRAMMDERGKRVDVATPSMPVQVLGFNDAPQAGDSFFVVDHERKAREIATNRQQIKRESDFRRVRHKTLDDISEQIKLGGVQDLSIVVKGDVDGSIEALSDSLLKLSTNEVRIDVIHKGVGAISESDVLLASASNAIIIGFRVRPHLNARKLAEAEDVDIRMYDIIYDAIEDVRDALEGMLKPEIREKITATVLVREVFRISRIGAIAGCYVQDGKINRNARVRLLRDGIVTFNGGISSLKRFKDDVREVDAGFECGISLEGFNDIKVGDVIESYEQVEVKRSLEQAK